MKHWTRQGTRIVLAFDINYPCTQMTYMCVLGAIRFSYSNKNISQIYWIGSFFPHAIMWHENFHCCSFYSFIPCISSWCFHSLLVHLSLLIRYVDDVHHQIQYNQFFIRIFAFAWIALVRFGFGIIFKHLLLRSCIMSAFELTLDIILDSIRVRQKAHTSE